LVIQVNIHEAKTHLSRLIAAIKSGKETEIIMAKKAFPPRASVRLRRDHRSGASQSGSALAKDCSRFRRILTGTMRRSRGSFTAKKIEIRHRHAFAHLAPCRAVPCSRACCSVVAR
jgi:antitoxin (DNA-binding transcriptional repressor) of toxin-antitoxin stability system